MYYSEASAAAALALAAVASDPDGRQVVRKAGGIPPLARVMLGGLNSEAAGNAAMALSSCSVDDDCKVCRAQSARDTFCVSEVCPGLA